MSISTKSREIRSDSGATAGGRFQRAAAVSSDDGENEVLLRRAIVATKAGDANALQFLYVRYADDVRGYVQSIVREPHDAEDITQSVFGELTKAIPNYEREVPFATWILRVARTAALAHMRARRLVPCEEVVPTSDEGYEQGGFERSRSLRHVLEQLPEEQREVLVLRYVAGLSLGEIAGRLDKSEGSIHGLHRRGRRALRAAMLEFEAASVTNTV